MAKYLTEFDTYAQYSGATLSLPNVSLIKNTGEVYYKNVYAGATLGDVLMYDIANDKLVTSFGGIWDSTTYPIASYTPIAINVYPASQTPDGKNRYLSVYYLDRTSNGKNEPMSMWWGPESFNTHTSLTDFNGMAIQDEAELLMPGTSGNTKTEYPAFYACSVFAPPGTSAGDWYLPSYKEMSLVAANSYLFKNKLDAFNVAQPNFMKNTNLFASTSTAYNSDSVYLIKPAGFTYSSLVDEKMVRAMISL